MEEPRPQDETAEPIIEVEGLRMSFGDRTILKDITFTVNHGSVCVILGGSGCGKSTLLRILIGAYAPDAGKVKVFGQDVTTVDRETLDGIRKRFGIVFQANALYSSMSVGDNIALPIREHTELHENIIDIMVRIKLQQVGMGRFTDLMPNELSGGMKKRVALARALALDPEILFYDEPTTGLDPVAAAVIDKLILNLSRKLRVTSVVVTHSMESTFRIADRIIMLYDGKIIADGTAEMLRGSTDPIVRQFIRGEPEGPITVSEMEADDDGLREYGRMGAK